LILKHGLGVLKLKLQMQLKSIYNHCFLILRWTKTKFPEYKNALKSDILERLGFVG